MKQVVFIADDFGLTEAANRAILRAHREGALTGASLMLGQPGTAGAVALAQANPTLQIGWHLHLCDSTPTTCGRWPWGNAPFAAGCRLGASDANRETLRPEIAQQWRLFQATGLRCAFVNAHHHLHVHPAVLRELDRVLPPDFAGWLRGFNVQLLGGWPARDALLAKLAAPFARRWLSRTRFRLSDTLWGLDRLFRMDAGEIRRAAGALPSGRHEFVFHPRGEQGDADFATLLRLRP